MTMHDDDDDDDGDDDDITESIEKDVTGFFDITTSRKTHKHKKKLTSEEKLQRLEQIRKSRTPAQQRILSYCVHNRFDELVSTPLRCCISYFLFLIFLFITLTNSLTHSLTHSLTGTNAS